jgi:hypothetical protein
MQLQRNRLRSAIHPLLNYNKIGNSFYWKNLTHQFDWATLLCKNNRFTPRFVKQVWIFYDAKEFELNFDFEKKLTHLLLNNMA